jgi:hypothetical protein
MAPKKKQPPKPTRPADIPADAPYPYDKYIKPPSSIGVSSQGTMTALGKDVAAISSYVGVLMSGKSNAQTVPRLGNKYFMDTRTTCLTSNGKTVPRYVFVNNVPSGAIANYQGLVPGILENTAAMNPASLFSAFVPDTPCQKITMTTVDANNKQRVESNYVMEADIKDYSPCLFQSKRNPVSGAKCTEGMQMPRDPVVSFYFFGVGVLAAFVVFRLVHK